MYTKKCAYLNCDTVITTKYPIEKYCDKHKYAAYKKRHREQFREYYKAKMHRTLEEQKADRLMAEQVIKKKGEAGLLTLYEMAGYLRVQPRTAKRYCYFKGLEYTKSKKGILIKVADLYKFLEHYYSKGG